MPPKQELEATLIPFSEARSNLTDVVNEVAYGGERVILTRKGKNLVALVPLEDLAALTAIENMIDLEDAKEALRDIEKHGTISWQEVKRQLDLE